MDLKFQTIDQYHNSFSQEIKKKLDEMRTIILSCSQEFEEVISYNMPAFKINRVVVYYAGYKNHIGFYPTPNGIKNFEKELEDYKTSKGAIQFSLDKKLPSTLIKKIVKFRIKEDSYLKSKIKKSVKKN